MPVAAIIPAVIGAAGAVGGGMIASSGANKAANAQASAANYAATLQKQASDAALAEQQRQFNTNQTNIAPWLKAGTGAIGTLSDLTSKPGEGLLTPWTEQFQAPTGITEQNDPGFQARISQGMKLMQQSAAAKGNMFTGGTQKALINYGQTAASAEYGNVYNRAYNDYTSRYNTFQNNQANEYNRLAGMSGVGQTAATTLGQMGQASANQISSILMNTGQAQGGYAQDAGAARASGYQNSGNIWGNAIGGVGNSIMSAYLMNQGGFGGFGNSGWGGGGGWTAVPGGSYKQVPYDPSAWGG